MDFEKIAILYLHNTVQLCYEYVYIYTQTQFCLIYV